MEPAAAGLMRSAARCRAATAARPEQRVWLAIALGLFATVAYVIVAMPQSGQDFAAFYCAGKAAAAHTDPYRALATASCQHAAFRGGYMTVRNLVIPAPLPPYALAAFRALSALPFAIAVSVWRAALIACLLIAAVALRALSGLAWAPLILSLVPIGLVVDVMFGQPVPLVLAALALAGLALHYGRDRRAAVAACIMMIEPHLGLPACVSLLLYRRVARPIVLAGAVIGGLLCLAAGPPALSVEYVRGVLPAQANAEVGWFLQLSLTHVLWVFGVPSAPSVVIGSLSYVGVTIAAVALAPRIAAALESPALIVAFPAAMSALGGNYMHIPQIAIALPAAIIFSTRGPAVSRAAGAVSLALLCFVGVQMFAPIVASIAALAAAGIAATLLSRRVVPIAAILSAAGAICFSLGGISRVTQAMLRVSIAPVADPATLAQESWRRFVVQSDPGPVVALLSLLAATPTFIALLLLLACGLRNAQLHSAAPAAVDRPAAAL